MPYDDGRHEYYDLTGQNYAQELMEPAPGECPGGTIRSVKVPDGDPSHPNVKGLCTTTRSRGHAYRMHDLFQAVEKTYQQQGKDLLVYTVNQVGWYEYITEWRFQDDGTISMNVGATGSLSFDDYNAQDGRGWPIGKGARDYSTSHSHNSFHHIARDEDQQPMPVHWQGFAIAPRDVTAMNPLTPKDLAWQNGHWEWRS